MADVYKVLYQGQPGIAAATIYTVPAGTTAMIKHITVINTSTTNAYTIKFFQGGTAAANQITPAMVVDAGGMVTFDGAITMAAATTLAAQAEAATTLTVTIGGVEVA